MEGSEDARPSWSKDGQWIYFGSNRGGGGWQVWKAHAQGGPAVRVTREGGREAFESADGKFVYYTRFNVPGIWRVAAGGGEEIQVLDHGLQGFWAVMKRGIYLYNPNAMPAPAIEFFSFDTRRMSRITALPQEARFFPGGTNIAVSPDARWILYV